MEYKIIVDSSCDLSENMKKELDAEIIPFNLSIDGKEYIDNEDINLDKFMSEMKKSKNPIKTSCPGPGDFLSVLKEYKNSFVITISSKLSGSYNSAKVAEDMLKEEMPENKTYIFDSESASAGEVLQALKLKELIDLGKSREEIIAELEKYIKNMRTFFILESLENLIKNGRISKTKGLLANVLNFKPIMSDNGNGEIILEESVRGTKRAFNRLVEIIGREESNFEDRDLVISHNNAVDTAESIKIEVEKKYNFRNIYVVETKGLSGSYAYDGGVVIAF